MRHLSRLIVTLLFLGTACFEGTSDNGDSTPGPDCEDYCELVEACVDDLAQYSTAGPCKSFCDHVPVGNTGDATGNTLGCRQFYAIQAGEDPTTNCAAAGPGGAGVCGGECQAFCEVTMQVCTEENAAYDDVLACTTACQGFDPGPPYNAAVPNADTLACRIKHLTFATLDADTHCPHIVAESNMCAD